MANDPQSGPVPPPGEQIHLPEPSLLPLLTAFGITIALVGVTTTWLFTIAGGLLALVCIWRWIRHTRRDIADLPLEHDAW